MRQLNREGFLADTLEPNQDWLRKYIDPADQPEVLAAIAEAVRTKSVFELEHRVRRKDESLGWTLSRAVPVLNADGDIIEWIGAAQDITAQKEARKRAGKNAAGD
jgi:PAS domain S-box-containing protein